MAGDLELLSQETLEILRKAQTSGLLVSTGVQGVDLSGLVSLVPVNVPARNNTSAFPRVIAGEGSQTATWRSLLNVNSSQASGFVGMDFAGAMTQFDEQDVFAPYLPVSMAGRVTLDAVAVARNYADALAVAELQVLNQLFIQQDFGIINGQAWSTGAPSAPTLVTNQGTGGTIPTTTTISMWVAARSGANYFQGGSSLASSVATATATSSNGSSISATVPAVKGAVAYDWYAFTSTTEASAWYVGTTTTGSFTLTSVPSAAAAVTNLPLISTLAPGQGNTPLTSPPVAGNGHPPTSGDTSFNAAYYNGIIASTLGDYGSAGPVKPGTGTANGSTFIDNGGSALQLSGGGIDVLDKINDSLWASVQLSPTAYMVNSLQADEISKLILSTSSALTFLPPTDADARTNLAGGGYIGRYVNRAAGGVPVAIEVHPRLAPGTIIARTDHVPFPGSNIGTTFQVRCQYDTMRFDYAANYNAGSLGGGPRYDFEIRSMETLVNTAPVAQCVVANVA